MRVKIADLKTNLSRYVQSLRDGGDPIEVCVRDQPVAYLTAAPGEAVDRRQQLAEAEQRLARRGVVIRQRVTNSRRVYLPGAADDGLSLTNSVVVMRAERDW
jgi:antitoxin (DNA-binding transcriptional repressor) of toxin-antitoxin stability system